MGMGMAMEVGLVAMAHRFCLGPRQDSIKTKANYMEEARQLTTTTQLGGFPIRRRGMSKSVQIHHICTYVSVDGRLCNLQGAL